MRQYFEIRPQEKISNLQEVQFYAGILGTILDYLESKRIIHRDIKPDNLIIDYDNYAKAIDFGIAKDMTGKASTNTIIGTVQYLAPWQKIFFCNSKTLILNTLRIEANFLR